MSNKQLIIPILTPLRRIHDNRFIIEMLKGGKKHSHNEVYIDSRTLNHLKNSIGENYDFVVPAMTTGEGDYLDFELWKSITDLTINIFRDRKGKTKCIPCILDLNPDFVEKAFTYLQMRRDIDNIFLPLSEETIENLTDGLISSLIKNWSFHISLYVRQYKSEDERLSNEQIIKFLKKNKDKIRLIKDSRGENSAELINDLISKINKEKLKVKVFQGWEQMYAQTDDRCAGGAFPLANLQPKFIYDFVKNKSNGSYSCNHASTIKALNDKYNDPQKWISLMKNEFISRPTHFDYDYQEFSNAISKFFKEYSEESLNNFHVEKFEVHTPLKSMCRTFLSDLLSFQAMYFRNNKLHNGKSQFLFLPLIIAIHDLETGKGFLFRMERQPKKRNKNTVWKKINPQKLNDTIMCISDSLFRSNYFIEENLFINDWFTEFSGNGNGDIEAEAIKEYFEKDVPEKDVFSRNKDSLYKHITQYNSEDKDNPAKYEIRVLYYKNPNLGSIIPDSVFDFLARIAIFTKRNRLAVDSIERQAIRAAISQVMARNMSHNIGSHVLSRMITKDSIEKLINSNHQYTGFSSNDKYTNDLKDLVASFNTYLKSRMDFLADVTTGVPTIENSKWFFKEILSGIDKNRLLLDTISGISDFHYKIIARNFIDKTSDPIIREEKKPGNNEKYEVINDFMVSIPNDVLGCHALYIIIENIIRNCVKHGSNGEKGKTSANPLNIFIDIKECPVKPEGNEFYELTIYDDNKDSRVTSKVTIKEEEKNRYEFYFPKNSNGRATINRLDKLIFDQNCRLNQSILKNGALRQGSWGLIEMDASAAYLRKIPVEEIDKDYYDVDLRQTREGKNSSFPEKESRNKQLNILKAVNVQGKNLGYKFFLFKPREILIIDDNKTYKDINEGQRNDLLKEGILLTSTSSEKNNFAYNPNKVYNHKLVVIISDNPEKIIEINRTGLSERILKINSNDLQEHPILNLLTDIEKLKREAWVSYIKDRKYHFYEQYVGLGDFNILPKNTSSKKAYYSNHGEDYRERAEAFKEIKYSAVEGFLPKEGNKGVIRYIQFIDSIHNKIVILDERIQEYAKHGEYKPKNGKEIPIKDIYDSTNIYVPQEDICNLSSQNFDDQYLKILRVFKQEQDASFFIIHLGIIEKLIESHNKRGNTEKFNKDKHVKEFLKKIVCEPNLIEYCKLVIISGRGTPNNLPPDIRYLNYSIISQYMIDLRFKYLLSEAVFSSRRIKQ